MAGIGKSGPSRPVANRGCLAARITEIDGRGGFAVEMAGGIESFKHQMISVPLRMISEVLNFCDRAMKGENCQTAYLDPGLYKLSTKLIHS